MKLYYSNGACSLSPHIVLRESGLPFTLVRASTKTHALDDGTDYYTINPKGSVPLLELDNGERLSEGDLVKVKVLGFDDKGRVKLSRKVLLDEQAAADNGGAGNTPQ